MWPWRLRIFNTILKKPIDKLTKKEIIRGIDKLEEEMKNSAKALDFEKAALYRDHLKSLRERLEEKV